MTRMINDYVDKLILHIKPYAIVNGLDFKNNSLVSQLIKRSV